MFINILRINCTSYKFLKIFQKVSIKYVFISVQRAYKYSYFIDMSVRVPVNRVQHYSLISP